DYYCAACDDSLSGQVF
nr:immunoglobulin light chain junction region [Macaca mulatta]MOX42800.1 immunoglobulin light chain junction region [Macaca mulatta]MOX45600.1 immunoglobulin light chain junction region [Macaca mulatta]MOX47618.1 immunoglobulin light chain junction region [Macaca mulatta]